MSIDFGPASLNIDSSAFAPPKYPVYRFSVADYLKLADEGSLAHADVELLEGVIVPKMTRNSWHDAALGIAEEMIMQLLSKGWTTRVQMALVAVDSVPEPDIAVVRGTRRDYVMRRPGGADAALVVEVAESSLPIDRQKASIYAATGVPAYWIINGPGQCVEVFERPLRDASGAMRYQVQRMVCGLERIELLLDGHVVGSLAAQEIVPDLPAE